MKSIYLFIFYSLKSLLNFLPDNNFGNSIRGNMLGVFFKERGKNLQISKNTNIMYPWKISVGNDVYIGFGCWINAMSGVELKDEVITGPYVCISTGNHTKENNSYRFGKHITNPVVIEKGVWLAAHAVVLAGSHVSAGSCVAAGAVGKITRGQIGVHGGVPVKLIKEEISHENEIKK